MAFRSILMLGGSGFVGRRLALRLSERGCRVMVATRRYMRARPLLVLPNLTLAEADLHDDAALARLVGNADAVINLVGILHSRPARGGAKWGPDFDQVHVQLPRRVAAACAAAGVSRLLHMSALGADPRGPSMYLRSKAAGEAAALSAPGVNTTVFRPSVIFGEEDRFLNMLADLQRWFPVLPLAGAEARFQPIHVDDVARAFVRALEREDLAGRALELAGPRIYTLRELAQLAGRYSGHPRPVLAVPDGVARLQAWIFEHLPGTPLMSRDNLDSMKADNVSAAAADTAAELGIAPTPLEAIAPLYLSAARA